MATVDDRLSALEKELQAVKQQLAALAKPRAWLHDVAGSMDPWPEFEEVMRLGREFRQKTNEETGDDAVGD
jgi:hypothetical protein